MLRACVSKLSTVGNGAGGSESFHDWKRRRGEEEARLRAEGLL